MAMCKAPKHQGGHAPPAGELCRYLVQEEDREQVWTFDGSGKDLDSESMQAQLGGYNAQHWHAIVAPSTNECLALIERYGSLESAAKEYAKSIGLELTRATRCPRPCVSIHVERLAGPDLRFHFHYVGKGPCPTRMFGEKGALQRSWDRAWNPDRKPIKDWDCHRQFLAIRAQLREVTREQREVNRARQRNLVTARLPSAKRSIRDQYLGKETGLIHRRHTLERAACDARYGARMDLGGPSHLAELQCIEARKAAALGRISGRTIPRRLHQKLISRAGRAVSSAKRRAKRVLSHALPISIERLAHRLAGHTLQNTPKALRPVAHQTIRVSAEGLRLIKSCTRRVMKVLIQLIHELIKASYKLAQIGVRASARESARGVKVMAQIGIGLVAVVPTLGGSLKAAGKETLMDAGSAAKDLGQDSIEAGQVTSKHALRGARHMGEAAVGAVGDGVRAFGTVGLSTLPRPARHTVLAIKEAARTTLATTKDLLCLDLKGAVMSVAEGTLRTGTAVTRSILPITELPAVLRVPIKAAEMIPIIGLGVKVAHLATKVAHGIGKEFER